VVGELLPAEMDTIEAHFRRFAFADVPALTSGNMYPNLTVRRISTPLTRLTRYGARSWHPHWNDIGADRDRTFDAVFVIFQTSGVDQVSGRPEQLANEYGGLASLIPGQIYVVGGIFGRNAFGMGRNLLKHEFGHGILFHFDAIGASPKPAVNNHIAPGQYVLCGTAEAYVLQDETDARPIPNSIYNNESGFTHDYYSGTTATVDQPNRCLGITAAAWTRGGPVSRLTRARVTAPPTPPPVGP
jgi:hypothetical protein